MADGPRLARDIDLEQIRAGIRLMALRVLRDPDLADDIAQESLARAIAALQRAETTTNLGAYVAGIARHVIADHFRARARIVSVELVDPSHLQANGTDPLAALCAEDDIDRVRRALGELSDDDHELIRLCYFDGLTPSQIAERMGAPPERIRQRKLRALQRLRVAFEGAPSTRHASAPEPTSSRDVEHVDERRSAT